MTENTENKEKVIPLHKLEVGMSAYIVSVNNGNVALRSHVLNMGLTPGVKVTLIKKAPMGDPMEFRVRGYILTLRKETAAYIVIRDIHKAVNIPKARKKFEETSHAQIGENITYEENRKNKIPLKTAVKFALAGNQNSGKTTLFNKLTGSSQHVGNFPGVTVDRTDGIVRGYKDVTITDLPGIYSLSPYTKEEIVTRDFIINEKPDAIINIIDATNIERNLLLTMQLLELNIPMVIALNMMDEIEANRGSIDINGLEKLLGVPVIPVSAMKNEGIDELIEHAVNVARYREYPEKIDFCEARDESCSTVHRCIHSVISLIDHHADAAGISPRFAATKLTEGDNLILKLLNLNEDELNSVNHLIEQMEKERGLDRYAAIIDMRFNFIEKLCFEYVLKPEESKGYLLSQKADKILTGKYSALPVFLLIMAVIFYLTFGSVGAFLSDITAVAINKFTGYVDVLLTDYGLNPLVHSLIINGIFAGVGSILSFLPVIVVLFFFLSVLEDTGYMARIAFVMDKALRKIGLSGRSFVPMLIGFGCSVPAIMATRTLPSERDRKMTALLIPFMSCSAKLPVYAVFTEAFFPENRAEVVIGLYLIGIVAGLLLALAVKPFMFKGKPVPFVMELPNYRFPSPINIYRLIYMKAKDFVSRAFTLIFWATIVIWFLQSFDEKINLVTNQADSMLAAFGNILVPIFKPLGINDWRISTAFLSGFTAKESVISTLTVLVGGDVSKIPEYFSKLTAFVFLVFTLLYTPCVAAIATVRKELGKRYAFGVVVFQCVVAWCVAFLVYTVGKLFI